MATKKISKPGGGTSAKSRSQKVRFWLMYPPKLITRPVVWELGHKFTLITNVRQASVTDEIGIVCLELDGSRAEIKAAISEAATRRLEQVSADLQKPAAPRLEFP